MPVRPLTHNKILWAVDPFEESALLRKNAIRILYLLRDNLHLDIDPVYVLRPEVDETPLISTTILDEQYRAAQTLLEQIKENAPELKILPPKVIRAPAPSVSSAVDTLCGYARTTGASLILANTHGKQGLKRLFLGSFGETLLLRSRIPVITVNPHAKKLKNFHHILFPTEFGRRSYHMFKETIELARTFSAKVTIFHAIPYPVEPYMRENVVYPQKFRNLMNTYLEKERVRTLRRSRTWSEWAQAQGVKVQLVIETRSGSIWKHLINIARRRHINLIAMESQSGPAVSNLIGSTTRQLVRNASCPVWILRSRYAERIKQPAPRRLRRAG